MAAVSSDRLYPPEQQAELAAGIPGAGPLRIIDSPYGHDGFLIEAADGRRAAAGAAGELISAVATYVAGLIADQNGASQAAQNRESASDVRPMRRESQPGR